MPVCTHRVGAILNHCQANISGHLRQPIHVAQVATHM
ncbi:hypothetical protein GALL_550950 [mine drainage metagenome]|uniref:Uncharacterized protein n=1 Tax=mine drainage metagenome TaxID=410659 RepID=A0A1J5PDQ9_9ZZZZ